MELLMPIHFMQVAALMCATYMASDSNHPYNSTFIALLWIFMAVITLSLVLNGSLVMFSIIGVVFIAYCAFLPTFYDNTYVPLLVCSAFIAVTTLGGVFSTI